MYIYIYRGDANYCWRCGSTLRARQQGRQGAALPQEGGGDTPKTAPGDVDTRCDRRCVYCCRARRFAPLSRKLHIKLMYCYLACVHCLK